MEGCDTLNLKSCRSTQGDEHADRLSAKSLTAQLEEWLPDAVGAGEDCSFTESLAAELTPVALAEYQEAQAAIFLAGAEVGLLLV